MGGNNANKGDARLHGTKITIEESTAGIRIFDKKNL